MGTDDDTGRSALFIAAAVLVALVLLVLLVVGAIVGSAVIAAFVLDTGEEVEHVPHEFKLSSHDDGVDVTYLGDESFAPSDLQVVVEGRVVGTWAEIGNTDDPVERGGSITVAGAESGDRVTLQFYRSAGEPVTVFEGTV